MVKDCFDCTFVECANRGRNSYDNNGLPPKYCMVDPIIDRYVKRKVAKIPIPCNSCMHNTDMSACFRCTYKHIILGK